MGAFNVRRRRNLRENRKRLCFENENPDMQCSTPTLTTTQTET